MKTKHLLPLFAALCFFLPMAQAQYNNNNNGANDKYLRNEFYAEYGVLSTQSIIIGVGQVIADAISDGDEVITSTGTIGIGYNRYLSPRWTLGAVGNYSGFRTTHNSGPSLNSHDDFYTFLVQADVRWINRPGVQLYSGLGLGATFWKFSYDDPRFDSLSFDYWFFHFQYSPLGIRVGRRIGGFLELGFGGSGMLCGGVSGKF